MNHPKLWRQYLDLLALFVECVLDIDVGQFEHKLRRRQAQRVHVVLARRPRQHSQCAAGLMRTHIPHLVLVALRNTNNKMSNKKVIITKGGGKNAR